MKVKRNEPNISILCNDVAQIIPQHDIKMKKSPTSKAFDSTHALVEIPI